MAGCARERCGWAVACLLGAALGGGAALGCGVAASGPELEGTQGEGRPNASEAAGETGALALECGNGLRQPGESCDDGNEVWGDGCNPDCTVAAQTRWARSYSREGSSTANLDLGLWGDSGLFVVYGNDVLFEETGWTEAANVEVLDDDGEPIWSRQFVDPARDTHFSGATAFGGEVYVLLTNRETRAVSLVGLDAAGDSMWSTELFISDVYTPHLRITASASTLAIVADTGDNGLLFRIDRSSGEVSAQATLVTGGSMDVGAVALDADDGIWASIGQQSDVGARVWRWEVGGIARPWRFNEPYRVLAIYPGAQFVDIVAAPRFDNLTYLRRFDQDGTFLDEVYPDSFGGYYDFYDTFFLVDVLRSTFGGFVGVQAYGSKLARVRPDGGMLWHRGIESGLPPSCIAEGPNGQLFVAGTSNASSDTLFWISSIAP